MIKDRPIFNKFSLIKFRMLGIDKITEYEILDTISETLYKQNNSVSSTYDTYYDEENDETYVWFNYESFINKNLTKKCSTSFIKKTISKYVRYGVLKRKTFYTNYKGKKTYLTYGYMYDWLTEYVYFYDEDCYARDCLHENIILTDKEYETIVNKLRDLEMNVDNPYDLLMYMNDLSEWFYDNQNEDIDISNLCGYILKILNKFPQEVLH